jgi:hypothetical protein
MLTLGVMLTALAILLLLTLMALWASGQLRHPVRVLVALAGVLVAGLALLLE